MPRRPVDLPPDELTFLRERHLGTLTTLRIDGSPHMVARAFCYDTDTGTASIISSAETQKVRNLQRNARAVVCQWMSDTRLSLEGPAPVSRDPDDVRRAVAAFETHYRPARENPRRVAIEIVVDRILGGS